VSRAVAGVIVIVVSIVAGAGVYLTSVTSTGATTTSSQPSGSAPVDVSIDSGASDSSNPPGYTPDSLTVIIGVNNTVTWTNNDSVHHTVTSSSAPSGGFFNSGNIDGGEAYTHTFTIAGTYRYDCVYHSWMTGIIIVKASP
jgi:plastocyanin